MAYLLDTIVVIWAVRRLHEAAQVLQRLRQGGDLAISAISLLELRRALTGEEFEGARGELEGVEEIGRAHF